MDFSTRLRRFTAPIQGIIFDLDGVIADTNPLHYAAWKQLADEEGIEFAEADHDQMLGLKREDCLKLFLRGRTLDQPEREAWMARKNSYFHAELAQGRLQPVDGIVALLDQVQEMGLLLGVGSSSRNAHTVLSHLGLLDRFSVVGDGNSVVNSKPAPDIFLWVAGALRIMPSLALVVEDAVAGVQAARAGGFRVLGLGDCEALQHADHCVESLHQFDLVAEIVSGVAPTRN